MMTGHFRTLVLISALMGLFMAVGYLIGEFLPRYL